MEQSEDESFKIINPFKSEYLDIEQMKKRLETETDLKIRAKIKKQIELLDDALEIYTLHLPERN